jgi:hypothetical protein
MPATFRAVRALSTAPLAFTAVCLGTGCPPTPVNVTVNTQTVSAQTTATYASQGGDIDTTDNCSPETPPAPPFEKPGASPSDIVVGFQRWRNNVDQCKTDKTVVYRGGVSFTLPAVPTGQTLYKVTLEFDATSTSANPASPNSIASCLDTLFQGTFTMTGSFAPPAAPAPAFVPFLAPLSALPTGAPNGGFYKSGTLPAELPLQQALSLDSGDVTVSAALHQFNHFVVNLTPFYQSWMTQGTTVGTILFSTANEAGVAALPVASGGADPAFCLAHYASFKLNVMSL